MVGSVGEVGDEVLLGKGNRYLVESKWRFGKKYITSRKRRKGRGIGSLVFMGKVMEVL